MLYVLHGSDVERGRGKLRELIAGLQKRKPDAALLRFNDETFESARLNDLVYGQGLFSPRSIVVLDKVLGVEGVESDILEKIKDIAASENIFVLFEEKLNAKMLATLEGHADKVQIFEKEKRATTRPFDVFSLTDALGSRDRLRLWTLYQKAHTAGVSDEEIHGILSWQLKTMLLAGGAKSAEEASLKPFVFKKSLGFLKRYSREEVQKLALSFITVYHDARRGKHELGTALERLLLTI